MAPKLKTANQLNKNEYSENVISEKPLQKKADDYQWQTIIVLLASHIFGVYGLYLILLGAVKFFTIVFAILLNLAAMFSVTGGAHRLWSHRAYKATWQLKLFYMIIQTSAFQDSLYNWIRIHRLHHKFTDTEADPHNSTRGFFFSHIGWVLIRPRPQVFEKMKTLDLSDIQSDPFIRFQKQYYYRLLFLIFFAIPTFIPSYFWNETITNSICVAVFLRYLIAVHATFLINSAAHYWGRRPYDKKSTGGENFTLSLLALGEGWHNYHHAFPWDYKASELGAGRVNGTTFLLDKLAKIGWAYDLKSVSQDLITKRAKRFGDGSHESIWGWGDRDQTDENKNFVEMVS